MFVFTTYSLLYTWIEIIASPIMHIHGSMFIIMIDSFLRYEEKIGYYLICLYCASYALCISLLATQFYYRYIVVCKPEKLEKLNGWRLFLLFIPAIFFFFLWYSLNFSATAKTNEKAEYARDAIMIAYREDTFKVAFIALQFWENDTDGKKHLKVFDTINYLGCFSIIAVCFSTILFCAFKIYFKLKCKKSIMSERTKELNKQLLKTLGIQTALPFFMMYSTVGIILTLPFFEIEVGKNGNIVGDLAGVYPALEPLVAMYFVKDFRIALSCRRNSINSTAQNYFETPEVRVKSQKSSIVFINKPLI